MHDLPCVPFLPFSSLILKCVRYLYLSCVLLYISTDCRVVVCDYFPVGGLPIIFIANFLIYL